MAENLGKVRLTLNVEIPVRKPYEISYVFDRMLTLVRFFQKSVKTDLGGLFTYHLIQENVNGALVRQECPHMVPGQESDSEAL